MSMKTETTTTEITIRGYGTTEDEAYANALKVADSKYRIFDAKSIRKVRNEQAWNVTFRVY